jgi:hypothetical protein
MTVFLEFMANILLIARPRGDAGSIPFSGTGDRHGLEQPNRGLILPLP